MFLSNLTRSARTVFHQIHFVPRLCPQALTFAINTKSSEAEALEQAKPAKKKSKIVPRITLISQEDNIQITTLEEAQRLSKRRDLKLVKIVDLDAKTQRPVYKLMTGSEYLAEDLKQRDKRRAEKTTNSLKGEKVLIMNSSIALHDIKINIDKILRWINKNYEVRVIINGVSTNLDKVESIYSTIVEQVRTHSRVVQKRTKGNDMKFNLLPPKKVNNEGGEGS